MKKHKIRHIHKITQPIKASDFPFTAVNVIKFIEDIIKIFIPIFKNKDPESPPVSGGTTTPSSSSS